MVNVARFAFGLDGFSAVAVGGVRVRSWRRCDDFLSDSCVGFGVGSEVDWLFNLSDVESEDGLFCFNTFLVLRDFGVGSLSIGVGFFLFFSLCGGLLVKR